MFASMNIEISNWGLCSDQKYVYKYIKFSNLSNALIIFLAGFISQGFSIRILQFGKMELDYCKSMFVSIKEISQKGILQSLSALVSKSTFQQKGCLTILHFNEKLLFIEGFNGLKIPINSVSTILIQP
jgi:hypothetical protein